MVSWFRAAGAVVWSCAAVLACSSAPAAPEPDGGAGAGGQVARCDGAELPERGDDDDDIHGLDRCRPAPTRLVIVGDSIADCWGIRGLDPCAPRMLRDHLLRNHTSRVVYEERQAGGARLKGAVDAALTVEPGPGALLVWVYVGGNDLASCGNVGPDAGLSCVNDLVTAAPSELQRLFDHFGDPDRFPDGVTYILNTQYSLFDSCQRPDQEEGFVDDAEAAIRLYNEEVLIAAALERDDTTALDHFPDFLGHAQNANRGGCPHCYADENETWLEDGIHPNGSGQREIFEKTREAVDQIFAPCEP